MPGTLDVEAVLAMVRQRGGRVTTARRAVIEALLGGEGQHLTADDLAARVRAEHPDVHLSTVYRTLDALEDLGVATHVHLDQRGGMDSAPPMYGRSASTTVTEPSARRCVSR